MMKQTEMSVLPYLGSLKAVNVHYKILNDGTNISTDSIFLISLELGTKGAAGTVSLM